MKKLFALLLALAMLLSLLSGCGSADKAPAAEEKPAAAEEEAAPEEEAAGEDAAVAEEAEAEIAEPAEIPAEAYEDVVAYLTEGALSKDDVIMTLNGQDVTAATFMYNLAYQYNYALYTYSSYGYALDLGAEVNEEGDTMASMLAQTAENICKLNSLMLQKSDELNVTTTEEQDASAAEVQSNYDEYALLYYATDMDTLLNMYHAGQLSICVQDYYYGEGGEYAPSEESLMEYADENGIYNCRYILQATMDLEEDDAEGRAAQQASAQALYDELAAADPATLEESFAILQADHNYDGNTEPFSFDATASLVSGFREKLAEMEIGELGLSDETDYGWFVLLRLPPVMEDVRTNYVSDLYNAMIDDWMETAEITTTEAFDNLDAQTVLENLVALQTVVSSVYQASQQ